MKSLMFLLMAPQGGSANPLMSLLPFVLIIVVFYFFMIRPQMKKQKEIRKFREEIKSGDKVLTTGGIYGKIADVKDNYVILEVEDKVRLRVDKAAIIKDTTDLSAQK